MSYTERLKVATDALWEGCPTEVGPHAWVSVAGSTNLTWIQCEVLAGHVLAMLDHMPEKVR